jgi:ubiquinone/menaquinone biosynthesis C-methylase UbiE
LKGAVVSCYGCDYSSEAVRLAKNKGLFVNQGGVESLEGRKFDILILSHVVEHFVNIKDELEKIKMIIKNDGIVYVEVPGVCDLENKKEYLYNYNIYSVLAHMHNFNLTSLRFVMESNGFELIKGNEYVKSLFKMVSDDYKKVDVTQNYKNTMECLERAIDKHIQIEKSPVRVGKRFVRRIAKSFIS